MIDPSTRKLFELHGAWLTSQCWPVLDFFTLMGDGVRMIKFPNFMLPLFNPLLLLLCEQLRSMASGRGARERARNWAFISFVISRGIWHTRYALSGVRFLYPLKDFTTIEFPYLPPFPTQFKHFLNVYFQAIVHIPSF